MTGNILFTIICAIGLLFFLSAVIAAFVAGYQTAKDKEKYVYKLLTTILVIVVFALLSSNCDGNNYRDSGNIL